MKAIPPYCLSTKKGPFGVKDGLHYQGRGGSRRPTMDYAHFINDGSPMCFVLEVIVYGIPSLPL